MRMGSTRAEETAMSTEGPSVPGNRIEPPTIEQLRLKLAQDVAEAQSAELQRHIRRLTDASTEGEAEAA
jgi:hypothetical protein